jgi:hypothetical protein
MHLPGLRGNPYGRQPTAADIGANHHGHSRLVAYPARLAALSVTVTVPKRVKAVPKTTKTHERESAVKRCRNWWQPPKKTEMLQ